MRLIRCCAPHTAQSPTCVERGEEAVDAQEETHDEERGSASLGTLQLRQRVADRRLALHVI